MALWLKILVLVLGVLALAFLISGVVPRYVLTRRRLARTEEFLDNYNAYLGGDQAKTNWLAARSLQMQHDAEAVGLGIAYIAPPPMIGGGPYQAHGMFADIFGHQSYADAVAPAFKVQTLLQVIQQLDDRWRARRNDLLNPLRWLQLAFERIVRFPRYLLKTAGFSSRVTESGFARVVTVIWSLVVGIATIGAFVLAIIQFVRSS